MVIVHGELLGYLIDKLIRKNFYCSTKDFVDRNEPKSVKILSGIPTSSAGSGVVSFPRPLLNQKK